MGTQQKFKHPGIRAVMDGNSAVILCEREASDAAGAYPITPSTQMGELWAANAADGFLNISGRPLIFIEPEGEHAAAAVTAGLAMTGLRAVNFSSGQGIAYMHESLYAAVGKRLTYVLNVACRAITKASLNVHCGHDDYHAVDDTGFFQVFGKNVQEVADLNLIAHRTAELALTPGIVAQDGFLTSHVLESYLMPERALIEEYLGLPSDLIETPTPAQRLVFGPRRRRIPELWDVDNPVMLGIAQNQESYAQMVAGQRPFFFDHIQPLAEQAMEEFFLLTGRRYGRLATYLAEDADYLLIGQGSVIPSAEVVAEYLRRTRGIKVGVVNLTFFRPFPGDLLAGVLAGKKGATVLERVDQPLAEDLPLMRETRAALAKGIENGQAGKGDLPYPEYPVVKNLKDIPALFSACFGMGSRDLQPEGLIGAVENMLPKGERRRNYYLSLDFLHADPHGKEQQQQQDFLNQHYPRLDALTVHGSENPDLVPKNSLAVRFHSVGGWGAITTGKNLAMTLFELFGYYVKANPKYGSEKKGQPTNYYMGVGPEPIRINCEYFYVDMVLSPDPNVFNHSNPLEGLKEGGIFIIQSDLESPEEVWASIPPRFQEIIRERRIRLFYMDAFRIAREESHDVELQYRMQGIAFQGAFFAATPLMKQANMTRETLFEAIEQQLRSKFGGKGARVVEDNLRIVQRGFDEVRELTEISDRQVAAVAQDSAGLPFSLQMGPVSSQPATDIHRFWEQVGKFYYEGHGADVKADPFISMGLIPAATTIFRDMTGVRFDYPLFAPEKCTGCGKCWTVCPDSAIPGLVNEVGEVFSTAAERLKRHGHTFRHLDAVMPLLCENVHGLIRQGGETGSVQAHMAKASQQTVAASDLPPEGKKALERELDLVREEIGGFGLAVTRPFYSVIDRKTPGEGGLLSITVNPYTCKGCMECVVVCNDGALSVTPQKAEDVARMRRHWEFWHDLPDTAARYIRISNLDEAIGALETLLLNKKAYLSMAGGDGSCLGCGEKTVVHLFTGTVVALMQPRVKRHLAHIDELVQGLEALLRERLGAWVGDTEELLQVLEETPPEGFTQGELAHRMEGGRKKVDRKWLSHVTHLISGLKELKWRYISGVSGKGRVEMGILNAVGCTSIWGSTYPFNPYPFPWANHLFQDTPSVAMGVFEGHMRKMADGFGIVRQAELELAGTYDPAEHDEFFTRFDWRSFTEEEYRLSPPVTVIGGDGAMNDIGFQNLSRMLMSGKPIKVLTLDTQVYSNTGGQACTSGFVGQVSDMAEFGKATQGKQEIRKELALIGIAHRTAFVMQGNPAMASHLIEGFVEGLLTPRPALFNVFSSCQPEHGIADSATNGQSKLALESRAYPIFRYNPDRGPTMRDCLELDGNPEEDKDWTTYPLHYRGEEGEEKQMEITLTFADFAATEGRFRKHFKRLPEVVLSDAMVPVAEFLDLSALQREGKVPFVWVTASNGTLAQAAVSETLVASCEERRDFWRMLKSLGRLDVKTVDEEALSERLRMDVIEKMAASLVRISVEEGGYPDA